MCCRGPCWQTGSPLQCSKSPPSPLAVDFRMLKLRQDAPDTSCHLVGCSEPPNPLHRDMVATHPQHTSRLRPQGWSFPIRGRGQSCQTSHEQPNASTLCCSWARFLPSWALGTLGMGQRMPSVPAAAGGRVPRPSVAAVSFSSSLVICTAELGAGKEVFVKLIKTTEARRKGKLISHGNQLDLIQKNKQRVRSVSLAGCFSGKGITRRFPPKGMALYCCSLCNWGFKSGTKSHYHKISLYGEKKKRKS